MLHMANYRTAMAHVDQAVINFKENGGLPTPALERAVKRARRACARGAGPPKHSGALPLGRLHELPEQEAPWASQGPCHPRRVLLCGSWWLTREIEAGNALIEDITFTTNSATWNLSASKADPRALGASRSHSCACGRAPGTPAVVPQSLCPRCCLSDQVAYALTRSKGSQQAALFPTEAGRCPSKHGMVDTIKAAAQQLKLDLFTASGAPAWGGHSLRRGGAQYLASCGIDVWRIQALARHSSNAILTYLDGIHAKNLGNVAAEAELGRSLASMREELRLLQASAAKLGSGILDNSRLQEQTTAIQIATSAADILPECASKAVHPSQSLHGQFVKSHGTGSKTHIRFPKDLNRTWCKWRWTQQSKATVHDTEPPGRMCIRCTEAALKDVDQSSSEDSLSS